MVARDGTKLPTRIWILNKACEIKALALQAKTIQIKLQSNYIILQITHDRKIRTT
jgi:hypothetical protein